MRLTDFVKLSIKLMQKQPTRGKRVVKGGDFMSDLLEVGDTVVVENVYGKHEYKITRVTKTLALSRRESDGYERRFYRDTKKKGFAHPKRRFDSNTCSIIKASK